MKGNRNTCRRCNSEGETGIRVAVRTVKGKQEYVWPFAEKDEQKEDKNGGGKETR